MILSKTNFLVKNIPQAMPVENASFTIKLKPVIDNVAEVDVVAKLTKLSLVVNLLDSVLKNLPFIY